MGWFRWDGPDLILQVQVQPHASRAAVAGVIGDHLKIRLTAPPLEGRANTDLISLLAKLFDVPKSQVTLLRGETSKRKLLRIHTPKKLPENLDWHAS
ncbi:MAG TPA: DUF167 family protein [Candidatus Methylomirabilis sp.]|nr:DUF167 family protein [Candidatus Methylomirabilis sp.]